MICLHFKPALLLPLGRALLTAMMPRVGHVVLWSYLGIGTVCISTNWIALATKRDAFWNNVTTAPLRNG